MKPEPKLNNLGPATRFLPHWLIDWLIGGERVDGAERAGAPGHLWRQGGQPAVRHPHTRGQVQGLRPPPEVRVPSQPALLRYLRSGSEPHFTGYPPHFLFLLLPLPPLTSRGRKRYEKGVYEKNVFFVVAFIVMGGGGGEASFSMLKIDLCLF